ncbi:MAG: hypothetical protein FWC01_00230 [Treponema sp.]|nr:hypothetical protein [Treponema sp.]MCL2236653.1 hypothetical protein [Treponema sp.]
MVKKWFAVILIIFLHVNLWAQEAPAASSNEEETSLPRQFRELTLGMSLDDLKEKLIQDSLFLFRGDRDVSFLPAREQSLVETTGVSFISRAFFQLRDGNVFIMSFTMNTAIIDHYSIFMRFVEQYGEPNYLDPRIAVWETEETRIAIERPLTVKYIDRVVFNDILEESGLIESGQVRMRQEFVNEF